MSDEEKRHKYAHNLASAMPGWDNRPRSLMSELRQLLATIKDDGTAIDSGGGDGTGHLWVTVDGVEYFISCQISNAHRRKD